MSLPKTLALEVLGLPSFGTTDDIVLRYKVLALNCFPENHPNKEFALQEFSNITQAAVTLLFVDKALPHKLILPEMYGFFQYLFFGQKENSVKEDESDYDTDCTESSVAVEDVFHEVLKAAGNASELIEEEEREKAKVEKRRAKKKRRKERRKLEKLETNTKIEKEEPSISKSKKPKAPDPKLSESEEDLDTNSAFVAVIAKKHKVPGLEIKDTWEKRTIPKEEHISIVLRGRQLAMRGNEIASLGHYSEAVELFSEAIKVDPSDHRFYGNRSYCYDRLSQFERALKDADKSITLSPVWAKGYFRKGRALLGLKKFAEAEQFFVEVLKLDNDCEDAIVELHKAKLLQLMEKGYSRENAESALSKHGSVSEALSSLLTEGVSHIYLRNNADIFISDDEDDSIFKLPNNKSKIPQHLYDVKKDPNNPENHNSLWIGNVQADVTEKKLATMFSKFGELIGVKIMPEKFCAFVNYKSKASPGKAMQALQGYEMSGTKLVIRFPNLPGETGTLKKKPVGAVAATTKKFQSPVNGNECYFWRNSGCVHSDQCRYQHLKASKGIDMK